MTKEGVEEFMELLKKDYGNIHSYPGLTIREWFAGMALSGISANQDLLIQLAKNGDGNKDTALLCYRVADAMIEASKK